MERIEEKKLRGEKSIPVHMDLVGAATKHHGNMTGEILFVQTAKEINQEIKSKFAPQILKKLEIQLILEIFFFVFKDTSKSPTQCDCLYL